MIRDSLGGWVLLLLAFITVAGGCGNSSDPSGDSGTGVTTLTYWSAPNPQEYAMAQDLVAEWNRDNPRIQVKLQALPAGQSSEEVLLSAMVAGTTPDICSNIWPGVTNDFIRAKGLYALDRFDDFEEVMAARVPGDIIESVRSADGHIYQIPWKTNPIMVQYNVAMFEDAGIDEFPRTYSEFLEAAAKITKDRSGDGRYDQWMGFRDIRPIWWQRYYDYYTSYITASGGKTFFDKGELAIDRKASDQVFGFYQSLYNNGYFPRSSLQGNAFLYGIIATEFTGPWNIAYLENNAPASLRYDFAPVPVPDDYVGDTYSYGDHKNIVIFSTTRHPEASWEFVKFLTTKEADYRLLSFARQIPVRKNLLTDPEFEEFFRENPMLARFAEQAAYTRGVDSIRDLKEILDAVARYYEKSAVYGAIPPEQATRDMIEAIRVIREWNK
ncbi:MAG: sugar ABC transporter substrate-binding protein [Balneolaceae bacterium]|nr:MAG: sugar ABC transporter substrate-binding protein [Balneolaceae bacterium]